MKRALRRLYRHESGQAMSEFVIVFPWVLIFFTVIIQLASMWEAYQLVNLASFNAVRNAAVSPGSLQPKSPDNAGGVVGAFGVSSVELAAELTLLPISPISPGRDGPPGGAFNCNSGSSGTCITDRGLPMLPHTGSDAAPSYSAELLALGAGEGHDNEDLHHRYIYAHNMTTVRMLADGNGDDVPDMNACDRVASSFIGAGLQALHVVPDGTDGGGAVGVETTYMYDLYVPLANWVIFAGYGVLSTNSGSCRAIIDEPVSYPADFSDTDFGVPYGGVPPWAGPGGAFWGAVRRLDIDIGGLTNLMDELANPIRPTTSATRFIPRDIIVEFAQWLNDHDHYAMPIRARTMLNLQCLEDPFNKDGNAGTTSLCR
ncbi:MAG: pilus assembly protein [Myxococcales bacterium]|nr:pilus assembly protein [Myxococcales bacterium]